MVGDWSAGVCVAAKVAQNLGDELVARFSIHTE